MKIQGEIKIMEVNGPTIIAIDNQPLASLFIDYHDKNIKMVVTLLALPKPKRFLFSGVADVFYYEGKDYFGTTKFANDFYIGDRDLLALLERYQGEQAIFELVDIDES